MRRLAILGVLALAGCQTTVGPFAHRTPQRVDDPCVSIAEQQRRGRDRLALPEESPQVAPPAIGLPWQHGSDAGSHSPGVGPP